MLITKTNNDTLFEIRHTKEYEDKYEKQKLMRVLPDKLQQISTPFVDKIRAELPILNERLLPVESNAGQTSK